MTDTSCRPVNCLIAQPASLICIAETDYGYEGNGIRLDDGIINTVYPAAGGSRAAWLWPFGGHSDGANFAYCDGHVKWAKWGQTMEPDNEWLPLGPGAVGESGNGSGYGGSGDSEAQFDAVAARHDLYWATNNTW